MQVLPGRGVQVTMLYRWPPCTDVFRAAADHTRSQRWMLLTLCLVIAMLLTLLVVPSPVKKTARPKPRDRTGVATTLKHRDRTVVATTHAKPSSSGSGSGSSSGSTSSSAGGSSSSSSSTRSCECAHLSHKQTTPFRAAGAIHSTTTIRGAGPGEQKPVGRVLLAEAETHYMRTMTHGAN